MLDNQTIDLEKLRSDIELMQKERKNSNAAVLKSRTSMMLAERLCEKQEKALEDISSLVKDDDTQIIELLGKCNPQFLENNKLPTMTVTIVGTVASSRSSRRFQNFVASFGTLLDQHLGKLFVAPIVGTDEIDEGAIIVVTSKFKGKFTDCCSSLHDFLGNVGNWREVAMAEMDPIKKTVLFRYHRRRL